MYSPDPDHIKAYQDWADIKGVPVRVTDENGKPKTIYKPTFGENLKFFLTYQVGYMYFRYFMWNFSGRENDTQGTGGILNGQWISGIKFIDALFLGNQDKLPDSMKNNPSRNAYYMLPLLLGLIGLFFQMDKDMRNFWVVLLFFIMTGLAIVVYLNQPPLEPRERDYAYAGSFYAFAIWIGFGVAGILNYFQKKSSRPFLAIAVTILSLFAVPGLMAKENWRNHDRSGRYTTRDLAADYLESCAPNSILFTVGDNDTFPLWYCQEVEGIRTDVRVVNLMLLNADWYIDQMKRKAYDSDPVPFSLAHMQYIHGTRNYIYIIERLKQYTDLKTVVDFEASDNPKTKILQNGGERIDYLPTRMFSLPVDTALVVANGTVSRKDAHLIVSPLNWQLNRSSIGKSEFMTLDLLAYNQWKRPIYFDAAGSEGTVGLDDYLQLDGFAWRIVPIATAGRSYLNYGRIDSRILYDNLMNKFKWGRMNAPDVFIDAYTNISHRFVAVSEDVRWRLDRYEGLDAARVDVIYNGVDVGPRLSPPERAALRQALGFAERDVVVGTVGRFDPIKNLPMLIESLAAARGQDGRIRGLLVGDGPEFGAVEQIIQAHHLDDMVRLTGFRTDARQLVQCMDLFVLSSFSEGTSMALLEAMASGVPAAVTAVGGNPEIVIAGETGWVVPSGAVAALTSAILEASHDPALRSEFGHAGRQRFEENFTFERMLECYRELYRSMMPASVPEPA